jgi:hypothetical protein
MRVSSVPATPHAPAAAAPADIPGVTGHSQPDVVA